MGRFLSKKKILDKKNSDKSLIDHHNITEHLLTNVPHEWDNYESIICKPISVNNVNKMKLLKRGLRSILKDPTIFFNKNKQSLLLHFDMHHGYGNMEKAIDCMKEDDKLEFFDYLNNSTFYNPHIMFIASKIL